MARCEDYPCCGHENGCCPRYSESGEQLDMVCVCGARLPVSNRVSICNTCLNSDEEVMVPEWAEDSDYSEPDTNDYDDETPLYHDYYGGE